jgi:hypothetical protein
MLAVSSLPAESFLLKQRHEAEDLVDVHCQATCLVVEHQSVQQREIESCLVSHCTDLLCGIQEIHYTASKLLVYFYIAGATTLGAGT